MDVQSHKSTSVEEFFDWIVHQEGRFELVNGQIRMMAGATTQHNIVKNNLTVALTSAARRCGCSSTTSDSGVRTGDRSIRYPDLVVDCGPSPPDAMTVSSPTILIEVSSPSTRKTDALIKLSEYQQLPSVQIVMQVEPDAPQVAVYRRSGESWLFESYEELDAVINIPQLSTVLAMADIYYGLDIRPRPVLQLVEQK